MEYIVCAAAKQLNIY